MNLSDFSVPNSRNIYEKISDTRELFMCIDALDFSQPSIKLRFCYYDGAQPTGAKIKQEVDIYIKAVTFLVFVNDVMSGLIAHKKKLAAENPQTYKNATYFEHFGGSYSPTIISRCLRLVNGERDAPFAFVATAGPGVLNAKGGIKPERGIKPTTSIFVNMPTQDLKEFCLIGKVYIEQYYGILLREKLEVVRKEREKSKEQRRNDD